MEFTLLFAALTATAALWLGARIWGEHLPHRSFDRLVAAALVGLVIGRLAAMLAQEVNPVTSPLDFIVVRGGVSTPAAAAGAVGWLTWSSRRDLSSVDAVAPVALLGLAGWHAGCLWRGACLGTVSDLPWAWSNQTSEITRHPVELYAALLMVLGAVAVNRLGKRLFLMSGIALALAGLARLITEPMRPSLSGGPVGWYVLAVVLGIAAAFWGGLVADRLKARAPT